MSEDQVTEDRVNAGVGLGLRTVANLRDLGGWRVPGGARVAPGRVYRSTDLSRLAEPDLSRFVDLGIRTVFDLRTASERLAAPDVLPMGAGYRALDVLADSTMAIPAHLKALLADPPSATQTLRGGGVGALFHKAYREIVMLPSARRGYRALFRDLAAPHAHPALVHCTAGKDRTGWAAAVLLLLLGVSDEDVLTDYLRTNDMMLPVLAPILDQFQAAGGDPALLGPVLGVTPDYLEAAFDEVRHNFGSVESYVAKGLRLSDETIDGLRRNLLRDAGP
ncbi:MAG: tyrosine-protein phosphatase [Candidatus Nanopelagicales bacterium]